jgi:hypothetical protein
LKKRANLSELTYLLDKHYTQEQLGGILGTSARYIRWMFSGRKSGAKHAEAIHELYEDVRREPPPEKKRRKPSRAPSLAYVRTADVVSILRHVFNPIEFKIPAVQWKYTNRSNRFLTREADWPRRVSYFTWSSFFIVLMIPLSAEWERMIRRSGKRYVEILPEIEEEDFGEDHDAPLAEAAYERYAGLSDRERRIISHLPVEAWLETFAEHDQGSTLVNFLVSRHDTAFALDPATREAFDNAEASAEETAAAFTEEVEGGAEAVFLGMYAFSGWKKKGEK